MQQQPYAYTAQPQPYNPNVQYQPYPQQPYAYPAGQYYYPQQPPPQVIYTDNRNRRSDVDTNTCWLISLLTLCCGCLLGEALCGDQCCCCIIPLALPRFRR